MSLTATFLSLAPFLAGDACPAAAPAGGKTIVETAIAAGEFQTLAKALQAAGLVDALQQEGPFTVFAPTDAAFAKLPKETLAQLLEPENAAALKTVLTYHVVGGELRAADVVGLRSAAALNGQRLAIDSAEGVRVAGASVVKPDVQCSNGVIHVIDRVLMPATKDLVATAAGDARFSILAKALGAAGLAEALSAPGPFTVFAPTDAAFQKLPQGMLEELLKPEKRDELVALLRYHVVPGRTYADQLATKSVTTLSGAKLPIEVGKGAPRVGVAGVLQADVETTNGVIHAVDAVLVPRD